MLRLLEPTEGKIFFQGKEITNISQSEMRTYRKDMQLVLQNPYSSLNPRKRVKDILSETLKFHGFRDTTEKSTSVLELSRSGT